MASAVYTEEQLNYFRICYIVTDILPKSLRLLFKQEWDSRHKATLGEWNDTPKNGLDFKNGESSAKQRRNARLLATMIKGNREEWDCTMLFYAILYSDSIYGLKALIQSNVDDLREFRNEDFAHMPQGKLSELKFRVAVSKVEIAFKQLGLSTVDIQTVRKQKSFPTDELQNVMKNVQKLIQDLQKKDAEVQYKQEKLQISEEQRLVLEDQLLNEAESFCVLPPRPPHPIAARDWEVAKVKQELSNLKMANANSLSYCYISGNPGSGKSQLAGLVAKTFYEEAIKDTSALSFVMTLSAESPEALMKSYVSLARNIGCPERTVINTLTSKDMTTEEKIDNLKDSVAAKIHLCTSWLLVVDNVSSVACTCVFLPEPENEQWGKGQLLIITQDSSCIPLDSSFTYHISISKGMELTDASRFLAVVSGITDQDLEDKVTKASELKFRVAVSKVEIAFKQLGLSTVDIQTVRKQKSFPTDEIQNVMKNVQKLIQDLQKKDAEVQYKQEKLQISEEQRLVLEDQLLNEAESFCVLPPRPPHPIAARDWEVAKVKQKLSNLKMANANSLSYCYISGNPGSGKSQLAGLVAKTFYEEAIKDTSALSFVMTLSAESPEALMKSYVSLARNIGCPERTVINTLTSKDMTTEEKIDNLKDSVATKIHLCTSWLLVVDNVSSVACTRVFLPEPENEQWGKGQLLIITQDSSCIPLDSSFTYHISISKGMELTDASRFLAVVSGITDQDLEDKVTKALDYQPLAKASAGMYVKQVRNTNPTFGWKDYLEKLEQGKHALTEDTLAKTIASYSNSMTVATRTSSCDSSQRSRSDSEDDDSEISFEGNNQKVEFFTVLLIHVYTLVAKLKKNRFSEQCTL